MSVNTAIVNLSDGRQVCLSYGVPVAVFVPGLGYLKTDRKYSVTSSRHANQFTGTSGREIPAAEFARLVAPLEIGS